MPQTCKAFFLMAGNREKNKKLIRTGRPAVISCFKTMTTEGKPGLWLHEFPLTTTTSNKSIVKFTKANKKQAGKTNSKKAKIKTQKYHKF